MYRRAFAIALWDSLPADSAEPPITYRPHAVHAAAHKHVRPGEKLYEEMFFSAEHVLPTDHPKVLRARNGLLAEGTMRKIDILAKGALAGEGEDEIRKLLRELVPDFQPHDPPSPRDSATPHREFTAAIA